MRKMILLLLGVHVISNIINASIIFVNQSASGTNNGTSWQNAYKDLSVALQNSTTGDEVWVAAGIYKPNLIEDNNNDGIIDPREVTFSIPSGIKLYGGFSGNESLLQQRNWNTHLTILSGDIDANDIDPNSDGIIEDVDDIRGKNAFHIVTIRTSETGMVINGFIINAGYASKGNNNEDVNLSGGGLYYYTIEDRSIMPVIENTLFKANFAKNKGGAMFLDSPGYTMSFTSNIINCQFIKNESKNIGGAIFVGNSIPDTRYYMKFKKCDFIKNEAYFRGGALYIISDFSQVDSCAFISNKAISQKGNGCGGAIFLEMSNGIFSNCTFSLNTASGNKNENIYGGGGAVCLTIDNGQHAIKWNSMPKFINCIFHKNVAGGNGNAFGGAVLNLSLGGGLEPAFVNCMFYKNGAQTNGGAVANIAVDTFYYRYGPVSTKFTNCTFNANHAQLKAGAFYNQGFVFWDYEVTHPIIENCILWKNTALVEGTEEIANTGDCNINYSIVKGCKINDINWNTSIGTDGGHNLNIDPVFEDEVLPYNTIGKKLGLNSPAINAGNNMATGLLGISTCLIGSPRVQAGTVDLGAFETAWLATKLKKEVQQNSFSLYPLPASDYVTIDAKKLLPGDYTLVVSDINGSVKKKAQINTAVENYTIDLKDLIPGKYVVSLRSLNGTESVSRNIVKK